tara:strand:+ start:12571 stop:12882 length:312 start_codon:yes stop_codon:yes gene_type:complete
LINVQKKGYRGEVEVLSLFESLDIEAVRAWGSDGRSIMQKSDVDILAKVDDINLKVQVKRRKKLPAYLQFKNCDLVATRQDRGRWIYILRESTFKRLLEKCVS